MSSLALGVLLLGEGVEEGSQDGDAGADAAKEGHGGSEDDAGGDDDHDALEGVGDGVGDGGEAVEGEEGGLVVEVEGEAGEQGELHDVLAGAGLDHGIVDGDGVLRVEGEDEGDGEDQGHDGDDGVGVLGAKSLRPGLAHYAIRDDVLEGGGLVGGGGSDEGSPGEGELLEGGETDTTDDGEEGGVDHGVVDVLQEEGVGGSCEHGLTGLNDLTERDGTSSEGEHGEGVGEGSPETNGRDLLPVFSSHLGSLAETSGPYNRSIEEYKLVS